MFNCRNYYNHFKTIAKKLPKGIIRLIYKPARQQGAFAERIKKRHRKFWKAANAEKIRNTIMFAEASLENWKDVNIWQRKLSNKFNAREFARKYDCKVAALYWKGRDCNNINFEELPEHYVIRPTCGHSLNNVFLMSHSINLMDGKRYSKEEITEILIRALDNNPYLEFLIEEFVQTEKSEYKIPDDYKFYMFNGKVGCIQVINRLSNSKACTSWYDENWNFIKNLTVNYPDGTEQSAPACLTEMTDAAKRLSFSYEIFCRIDFYATDKGTVFGEFTPTPGLGKGFTPAGDKLLTSYWDTYCNRMI